ncbi:MAG: hypothetical protein WC879_07415 [Melioribacteraceae bacterium]
MPAISRSDVKECVKKSLDSIADFSNTSNIEVFTFNHWHDIHKTIFINMVAACIRKKGSRIVLNEGMLTQFPALGNFIDYVYENSVFLGEPDPSMKESNGDLI